MTIATTSIIPEAMIRDVTNKVLNNEKLVKDTEVAFLASGKDIVSLMERNDYFAATYYCIKVLLDIAREDVEAAVVDTTMLYRLDLDSMDDSRSACSIDTMYDCRYIATKTLQEAGLIEVINGGKNIRIL